MKTSHPESYRREMQKRIGWSLYSVFHNPRKRSASNSEWDESFFRFLHDVSNDARIESLAISTVSLSKLSQSDQGRKRKKKLILTALKMKYCNFHKRAKMIGSTYKFIAKTMRYHTRFSSNSLRISGSQLVNR